MILANLNFSSLSFYICLVVALGLLVTQIVLNLKFSKSILIKKKEDYKKQFLITGLISLIAVIAFTLMMTATYFYSGIYVNAKGKDYALGIIGAFLFFASVSMFFECFILHYYDTKKEPKLDKILFYIMIAMVPCMLVFLFVMSDGYASLIKYPLVNGISFKDGFVTPESGKPSVAFYALFILSGALFVYFLCDHKLYVQYGKHGLIESTFLVAFPSGIIGARIFYVIGNWSKEFAGRPFYNVFLINEGGLTILGGAVVGIVVGVLWFMWRNKGYSIFTVVDILVPSILLAQAIGRWGNFFNCEVHGFIMDDKYWSWLPKIIVENCRYSSASSTSYAGDGSIFVPLFLIEGIVNVAGYFFLTKVVNGLLRKYTCPGDAALGYIAWYGATRTFMEPLRDAAYNMGEDGYWSWLWSMVFIAGGIFLIMVNHIVRYILKKKKENFVFDKIGIKRNSIFYGLTLLISLILIVIGSVLMAKNVQSIELKFNDFNIGLIVLIFGISTIFITCIGLPYFIDYFKNKKSENYNEQI